MGLFINKNNKKLCPICGNPTPRLLPTKVENMPICKECVHKVDLPVGAINQMSLDSFQQYMNYYEENKALREVFTEDYHFNFGFFGGDLLIDSSNRLFRLKNDNNALVFEAASLKGFCILEDGNPLYESGINVLKCYQSDVHDRVNAMAPVITQFKMQQREYEMRERIERRRAEEEGKASPHISRPYIELPVPVDHFYVELTLEHPYWSELSEKVGAPIFSQNNPSIAAYLNDYDDKVNELHTLATNLMQLICPGAGERHVDENASVAAPVIGGADEIKKYKELLDAGIITEEEFAAKKSQLLGI